ncbi:MAG: M28 family peptidase [Verrucomicrobia bacterium]|nr:M28 family peptidase [Verrucomicrobiota bacterium]
MSIRPFLLLPLFLFSSALSSAAVPAPASPARLLERTRVLASDELEGRGPGTRGEERTVRYLEAEFKKLGLQPGNPDGTYVQAVPLIGITSAPTLSFQIGAKALPMVPINDFVGFSTRAVESVAEKDTEVVFVGYGIVAPEFNWDDYKGVDVRGKTVVMLINDPPITDARGQLDPAVFGGNAMTYYGRWTYKYEIAAEKGAAACLIVHETGPAAYPFGVVITSWSRENFELRTPDRNAGHVALSGWLTLDATRKLFTTAGQSFDALKKAATTREFRPVPLGARASFSVKNTLRPVDSRNVLALLPGRDPQKRNEYVIYNAHWDHLGIDEKLRGDQIYNGAADNAAGTAVLLEIAQAITALPPAERPARSLLFLSVTAEERGLLGARYYAQNPLYPLARTLAIINMDGANPFGPTRDLEVIGHGATTMDGIAASIAAAQGREVLPDRRPDRGSYFRSDHFEFAKVGVPGFYAKAGKNYVGQPADFADRKVNEYIARDYHQPSDEVKPDWTFEGAAQDTDFLVRLGLHIAGDATWPEWTAGNPFKARRDAMRAAGR